MERDGAPLILRTKLPSPLTQRMEPWTGGVPLTLKSELLHHPELRGWPLDPARRGWSHGLMGR